MRAEVDLLGSRDGWYCRDGDAEWVTIGGFGGEVWPKRGWRRGDKRARGALRGAWVVVGERRRRSAAFFRDAATAFGGDGGAGSPPNLLGVSMGIIGEHKPWKHILCHSVTTPPTNTIYKL